MSVCDDDRLDDIEDIVGEGDLAGMERSFARSNAVGKRVKKVPSSKDQAKAKEINQPSEQNGSIIPGTQKIWVKTWGNCLKEIRNITHTYASISLQGVRTIIPILNTWQDSLQPMAIR